MPELSDELTCKLTNVAYCAYPSPENDQIHVDFANDALINVSQMPLAKSFSSLFTFDCSEHDEIIAQSRKNFEFLARILL